MTIDAKRRMQESILIPKVLYGSKSWVLKAGERRLDAFEEGNKDKNYSEY